MSAPTGGRPTEGVSTVAATRHALRPPTTALTVPAFGGSSQLAQAAYREGLTLPDERCLHGVRGCSDCLTDAIRRLSVLLGL